MTVATTARDVAAMLALGNPNDGPPLPAGVADLVRAAVYRWGHTAKASVTRWVRLTLHATGFSDGYDMNPIYSQLLAIGDIAETQVGGHLRLARVKPFWIRLGENHGCLIGSIPTSMLSKRRPFELLESTHSVVRRFRFCATCAATLAELEAECIGIRTWLGRYHFHDCASRRQKAVGTLTELWGVVERELPNSGTQAGKLEHYKFVTGEPGAFFGNAQAASGRWRTGSPGTGTWLAARPGYSDDHLNYSVVSISGVGSLAIDYDFDEWVWYLLARGLATGTPEVVRMSHQGAQLMVEATCPLPQQLRRLMFLWCEPFDGWPWTCPAEWQVPIQVELESGGVKVVFA